MRTGSAFTLLGLSAFVLQGVAATVWNIWVLGCGLCADLVINFRVGVIKPNILAPRTSKTTVQQMKTMASTGVTCQKALLITTKTTSSRAGTAPTSWESEILRDEHSM